MKKKALLEILLRLIKVYTHICTSTFVDYVILLNQVTNELSISNIALHKVLIIETIKVDIFRI